LWWIQRLQRDHPDHWNEILTANDLPGPMVLRVNRRQQRREAYLALLSDRGMLAEPLGDDGLVLAAPVAVEQLPGFDEGACSVQDGSAQLAARLLLTDRSWGPGDRLLDACAAPGGK